MITEKFRVLKHKKSIWVPLVLLFLLAGIILSYVIRGTGLNIEKAGSPDERNADSHGIHELEKSESPVDSPEGRSLNRKDSSEFTREQQEMIEKLEAIGYLAGTREAEDKTGVTVHVPEQAFSGFNFFVSGHSPYAALMDMEGAIMHTWSMDDGQLEATGLPTYRGFTHFWRKAHLMPNGDILVIFEGIAVAKLDKKSNLLWINENKAHHDLKVAENGDIYVLTRKGDIFPELNYYKPLLEDFITILDEKGKEKKRVSILDCFENSPEYRAVSRNRLKEHPDLLDIFHTNSLQILDGSIADRVPAFKKGNILISMCHLDAVAVIDLSLEQVVWLYQDSFLRQHDAEIVDKRNLILFDNHRGLDETITPQTQSRILEYDPATMNIIWEYQGKPDAPFFSDTCGTVQRLPNGNTLVTESDGGRAFELTPEKFLVWEFINPFRTGKNNNLTANIFELVRLYPDFPLDWLNEESTGKIPGH